MAKSGLANGLAWLL